MASVRTHRIHRIALIAEILDGGPLPADALVVVLNRHLQRERQPTVEIRMLQNDLLWLRNHVGDDIIESVGRSKISAETRKRYPQARRYYRLSSAEGVIPVSADLCLVTELEALALEAARQIFQYPSELRRADGDTQRNPLANAVDRLTRRLGIPHGLALKEHVLAVHHLSPDPYLPEVLVEILKALRLGQAIRVFYSALALEPQSMDLQPIVLVFHDTEPYFWAWDPKATPSLRQYKVSRVSRIERVDSLSRVPVGLLQEVRVQYLGAFRGYTGNGQSARVSILFSGMSAKQIRNRVYGTGQRKEEMPDGKVRLSFTTNGVDAVRRWVLRFGSEAVVEAPAEVANWVSRELRIAAEKYADAPQGHKRV